MAQFEDRGSSDTLAARLRETMETWQSYSRRSGRLAYGLAGFAFALVQPFYTAAAIMRTLYLVGAVTAVAISAQGVQSAMYTSALFSGIPPGVLVEFRRECSNRQKHIWERYSPAATFPAK